MPTNQIRSQASCYRSVKTAQMHDLAEAQMHDLAEAATCQGCVTVLSMKKSVEVMHVCSVILRSYTPKPRMCAWAGSHSGNHCSHPVPADPPPPQQHRRGSALLRVPLLQPAADVLQRNCRDDLCGEHSSSSLQELPVVCVLSLCDACCKYTCHLNKLQSSLTAVCLFFPIVLLLSIHSIAMTKLCDVAFAP